MPDLTGIFKQYSDTFLMRKTSSACGPFMFENITRISPTTPTALSSTVVFIANESISNTLVECRDSAGGVYNQVGNITICVVGEFIN